jgi:hypothetical protein
MKRTPAGRPLILGTPAPLTDASPEAWWAEEAARLGLSTQDLEDQVRLADSVLEELFAEEARADHA